MPGAETVPFDAGIHYIDKMVPDGIKLPLEILGESLAPHGRSLYLVRARVSNEVERTGGEADEPSFRNAVNVALYRVLMPLSPEYPAEIVGDRPLSLTKALPTVVPGLTAAEVLRTTISTQIREDLEPNVRAVLDREAVAAPAGP